MPQSKYLRRAKHKLAERIKVYEEIVKRRQDNGKGFRKPGSLKMKRN